MSVTSNKYPFTIQQNQPLQYTDRNIPLDFGNDANVHVEVEFNVDLQAALNIGYLLGGFLVLLSLSSESTSRAPAFPSGSLGF
jgi:hypothetical protein